MKILLLGNTGKMGKALSRVLSSGNDLVGLNSRDFSAEDFVKVAQLIAFHEPEIVINTVALLGIDLCELEPERAFRINTLFPGTLAQLCAERRVTLVQFSTDAVFGGAMEKVYTEKDGPDPINLYGITKYGGDCMVMSHCQHHYLFRIPILFGQGKADGQFVERMLERLEAGDIRVADDIVSSPSFSRDIAEKAAELLLSGAPYGTYHIANAGKASLYELMVEVASCLAPGAIVHKCSWRDFPAQGRKNLHTPLESVRIPSLRPWREAVHDYCRSLQKDGGYHE